MAGPPPLSVPREPGWRMGPLLVLYRLSESPPHGQSPRPSAWQVLCLLMDGEPRVWVWGQACLWALASPFPGGTLCLTLGREGR